MKNEIWGCAALAACLCGMAGPASAADEQFSVGAGIDYSTGKYGASTSTDITYLPFFVKYDSPLWGLKLTVPYVSISGPGNVVGSDRIVVARGTAAPRRTADGLGDVVAALTYHAVDNLRSRLGVDLVGKVKFATADENQGLGTGKNDYSLQADLFKGYGNNFSALGTIGYKVFGDPAGVDLDNVLFGSIGGGYRFSDVSSGGLVYDYRQKSTSAGSPVSEITAYVSLRLTRAARLQPYLVRGFSDGSPDWGAGVQLTYGF